MTAKFKHIIEQLNALVTFKADKSMSDDDFIANIEAINLLINVHDDLGLDRKGIRRKMVNLYPEFSRRIYEKENIQLAIPLIKALNDFIYGREGDRGPELWENHLVEMCCKVVDAYRKEPLINSSDYLFALDIVSNMTDDADNNDLNEYKGIIAGYLEDIDNVSLSEKIKRVEAYERLKLRLVPENWERWDEIREQLMNESVRRMDDETLLLWCDITDQYPANELKRRSGSSKRMMVEYLRSQVISEFAKQCRLRAQRKLARSLKTLNDNIIGDIIPLKINADMSVSSLFALETIFNLRLQLAQISDDHNASIYESLCEDRFEKIATALTKKYPTVTTLNEKIEILERLYFLGSTLYSNHEDFATKEASKLRKLPSLTYAQQLRLDWILSDSSQSELEIADKILSCLSPAGKAGEEWTSFEMATVAPITDFVTDSERESILNRYFTLLDAAIANGSSAEVGHLLTLSADWNRNPFLRSHLAEASNKAQPIEVLSLPEKRVNDIAAEIYSHIDHITGKSDIDSIPT